MTALSTLDPRINDFKNSDSGFALTTYSFPTGDAEIVARHITPQSPISAGGAKRKNKDKKDMDAATIAISTNRSRTVVRRKAMTFCPTILMTLTFRKNVLDLDEAWGCFKYFNKLMKLHYGVDWIYVCVPERQKRGAWHFHLAVTKRFHNKTWANLHVLWGRATGKRDGNVDMQLPSKRWGTTGYTWPPKKIAQYLCKYITKEANEVAFNRRRYSSAGVTLNPVAGWVSLAFSGVSIEQFLESLMGSLSDLPVEFRYQSQDEFLNVIYFST